MCHRFRLNCLLLAVFVFALEGRSTIQAQSPSPDSVAALNAFALELHAAADSAADSNVAASPFSCWRIAAIAGEGSAGTTLTEFDRFLRLRSAERQELTRYARQLTQSQESSWFLGVNAKENGGYGVMVTKIAPDSPAERAGLDKGDLVLSIDGRIVRSEKDYVSCMDAAVGSIELTYLDFTDGAVRTQDVQLQNRTSRSTVSQLRNGQAVWVGREFRPRPEYRDRIVDLGATIETLQGSSDAYARQINDWASGIIGNPIDLVSAQDLPENLSLALTDVLDFSAPWVSPFDAEMTRQRRFRTRDHGDIEVDMMRGFHRGRFAQGDGWKSMLLPFEGRRFSLLLFVPDSLQAAESALPSAKDFEEAVRGTVAEVDVQMPRVRIETQIDLINACRRLGLEEPFSDTADFSRMGEGDHYIEVFRQVASLMVDEKGAKATAATVATVVPRFSPPDRPQIIADRPYSMCLVDVASGLILFSATVEQP